MAGSHVLLKAGEDLFKEGEMSDGMYIVRSGDVSVYLNRNGTTINLAQLTAGAMIGEMALFENKPRSASAKATSDCEITKISKNDFARLTKQIPKWFVTLMIALSSRLRETNQRLQEAEDQNPVSSLTLDSSYRILMLVKLLWYKEGIKEGRAWLLDLKDAISNTSQILNMPAANVESAISSLVKAKLISIQLNDYKEKKLAIAQRSTLDTIIRTLKTYIKHFEDMPTLPAGGDEFFTILKTLAEESPYDEPVLALTDIEAKAVAQKLASAEPWMKLVEKCDNFLIDFKLTKTSEGISALKVNKKTLARLEQGFRAIEFLQAG